MADDNKQKTIDDKERERLRSQGYTPGPEAKPLEERVKQAYTHEEPTPTQAENDAAKLAALGLDPEEPTQNGAEPTQNAASAASPQRRTVEANPASGGYATRSTETKKPD